MESPLTFTPRRSLDFDEDEVKSLMTPEVRKNICQLFDDHDEDSGLGMDDGFESPVHYTVSTRLDFSNAFAYPSTSQIADENDRSCFRRSLFSGKRRRDEDEDFLSTPSKLQRRDESMSRGSTSFEESLTSPADVKDAVNRLVEEEDLIGDGTDTFCLPTIRGKHQDLKSISADTMADILTGSYDDVINDYRIIDCRYPYEYDGGHIQKAENMYTRDQVQQLLHDRQSCDVTGKRTVLIFHCEFSSERGPKMMRFLRTQDRAQNEANYPALTYPEMYLLDGGFKAFYQTDKTLCYPMEYKPMLHPGHGKDLRHFRSKSKSWSAGDKKKTNCRRHV
ncbi:M-phase inducer phosphatase-like [Argopecten irradians]|uniref:M-phase inducer phosphatase-like n=1 Tax=Argopecten irradians TaxID=31199 RepID=UPI0037191285